MGAEPLQVRLFGLQKNAGMLKTSRFGGTMNLFALDMQEWVVPLFLIWSDL